MFTIEKTTKIPSKRMKYPFEDMKVGESFALPLEMRNRVSVSAVAFSKKQNPKWKFTIRADGDKFRCYRIE